MWSNSNPSSEDSSSLNLPDEVIQSDWSGHSELDVDLPQGQQRVNDFIIIILRLNCR